jgi:CheY-like chemotaxis protein
MSLSRLGNGPPRFVLVVEDNLDGRETLRTLLELFGHHVEAAEDGIEGVQKALAHHPDVALIDIGLPRLDGFEVARQIRAALGRRIKLIAYTAYDQPETNQRIREAGFDAHLVKPVNLELLLGWLEERQTEAENSSV